MPPSPTPHATITPDTNIIATVQPPSSSPPPPQTHLTSPLLSPTDAALITFILTTVDPPSPPWLSRQDILEITAYSCPCVKQVMTDVKFVSEYRPISLIGCLYKVVTKILATRLSNVISDLVADVQTAFLPNRQILDRPFIINEVLSWCKSKQQQAMVFKVDFAKALSSGMASIIIVVSSKAPKAVLNAMESIRQNFFYGIHGIDKKIAWVKWSKILAAKEHGGLDVSSFFVNIQVPDLSCPVCKNVDEEVSHLLFSCPLSGVVHRLVCRWWNLAWSPLSSYEEWLSWFKDIRLGSILKNSSLKDSIDQSNLANPADNFVDSMPEMFTDEHAPDYSSYPIFDKYDDDLFEVESDTKNVYDDPFDSKGEKIKESKLDELDLPRDFLLPSEYDSFNSKDFCRVDSKPSTNNEDKEFNPCILSQENPFEIITRVVQDKKLAISNASLVLEDFDPPLYEPLFFKEFPKSNMLLLVSSENEEKVFNPWIHTSKRVYSSLQVWGNWVKLSDPKQALRDPMLILSFSNE
nr:RNA-directed DNA polymerase, eukaryota [Tanacetum cinerariifolium]